MIAAALVTVVAIACAKETRDRDLGEIAERTPRESRVGADV